MTRLKRLSKLAVGLAAIGVAAWVVLDGAPTRAADHGDSPAVAGDPTSDIADSFAWMSPDASKLYLAMTVNSGATTASAFSDAVQYVFHIDSSDGAGGATTTTEIICTFDADQIIQCWAGGDYATGDASNTAGLTSEHGGFRVFAGLRDDPFYFNQAGFVNTATAVNGAAGSLTFDANGCPTLTDGTAEALVGMLTTGTNDLAGNNVLGLVVSIDKTLINGGGDSLKVYASTHSAN